MTSAAMSASFLCGTASQRNVICEAQIDDNLKESSQDYVVDTVKHLSHITGVIL